MEQCKGRKLEFVDSRGNKCGTTWDIKDVIDFDPREDVEVSSMPVGTWLKAVMESRRGVIAELANDIAWDAVGAQIEPYLRQHA